MKKWIFNASLLVVATAFTNTQGLCNSYNGSYQPEREFQYNNGTNQQQIPQQQYQYQSQPSFQNHQQQPHQQNYQQQNYQQQSYNQQPQFQQQAQRQRPQQPNQDVAKRALDFAKGHNEFKNVNFKLHEREFVRLVQEGQTPRTLFIGCSDSRVVPELITQKNPGQLFVTRNAGNFVPTYTATPSDYDSTGASIQFAINGLGVQDIIVCGHSECGAIRGLYAQPGQLNMPLVEKWIQWGVQARKLVQESIGDVPEEEKFVATEKMSVLYQIEHLLSYPEVKKAVDEGKIYLHAWYFDIKSGRIEFYNPQTNGFAPLNSVLAQR